MTGAYIVLYRERGKKKWNIHNDLFAHSHAAADKQKLIERAKPDIETMRTWCEL